MEPKKDIVAIENVVASTSLNQRLDLESISKAFPNVEYRPEHFPGLIYKLRKPRTSTLIFSSGKMICTGAKSEIQAKKAIMKVIETLRNNGVVIIGKPEVKIQNIVASADLQGEIDLEHAANFLERTIYEPDQFPALIYKMVEPKVVILLFSRGKLICAGGRKESEVREAVKKLKETLEKRKIISYYNEVISLPA
ncbi:TATA-box-binding protein [Candidatus Bathyarchaeota archaeon]|nr:TATA-box-binding protein [Candidatus Bathyarchaeota archaeon]